LKWNSPYTEECGSPADDVYWRLTLDFGQRYAKMAVEWCDHVLKTINQNSESLPKKEQNALKTQGGTKHRTSRGVRKGKKKG